MVNLYSFKCDLYYDFILLKILCIQKMLIICLAKSLISVSIRWETIFNEAKIIPIKKAIRQYYQRAKAKNNNKREDTEDTIPRKGKNLMMI